MNTQFVWLHDLTCNGMTLDIQQGPRWIEYWSNAGPRHSKHTDIWHQASMRLPSWTSRPRLVAFFGFTPSNCGTSLHCRYFFNKTAWAQVSCKRCRHYWRCTYHCQSQWVSNVCRAHASTGASLALTGASCICSARQSSSKQLMSVLSEQAKQLQHPVSSIHSWTVACPQTMARWCFHARSSLHGGTKKGSGQGTGSQCTTDLSLQPGSLQCRVLQSGVLCSDIVVSSKLQKNPGKVRGSWQLQEPYRLCSLATGQPTFSAKQLSTAVFWRW